jgi:hypothetical protein
LFNSRLWEVSGYLVVSLICEGYLPNLQGMLETEVSTELWIYRVFF